MVLAEHERLELLPQIAGLAEVLWETRQGRVHVEVRSAHPLSDDALGKIRAGLVESLKINPILVPRLEPDLIGGLVIRVGDTVYDSSLRTQLKSLETRLRERSLNEIQSGRDRFSHSEGN
jgi:F-type H+-transporting ATPase subunit delta